MNPLDIHITRRKALAAVVGLAVGYVVLSPRDRSLAADEPPTLVWVWQFDDDGEPNEIGATLVQHGMGIVLKTHDGTAWMADYDTSEYAVSGPVQVRTLADYFEAAGIPFHAWAVVRGEDPALEAQMAADVLAGGARSLFLDLGSESGAWAGDEAAAQSFGDELRRLQPDAKVVLVAEPRPWLSSTVPLATFAGFCDEVAIKALWRSYDSPEDRAAFEAAGYVVPPEGVTPAFVYAAGFASLISLDLPKSWVADASTPDPAALTAFRDIALDGGAASVSLWRYGTAVDLAAYAAATRDAEDSVPEGGEPTEDSDSEAVAGSATHEVQRGETLSGIAVSYDVEVDDLVAANHLDDPDFVVAGQLLTIPD